MNRLDRLVIGAVAYSVLSMSQHAISKEVTKEYSLANPTENVIEDTTMEVIDAGDYQYLRPIEEEFPGEFGSFGEIKWHFTFEDEIKSANLYVPFLLDDVNLDPYSWLYIRWSTDNVDWNGYRYDPITHTTEKHEFDITSAVRGSSDVYVRIGAIYLVNGAYIQLIPSNDKLSLRTTIVPEASSLLLVVAGASFLFVRARRM